MTTNNSQQSSLDSQLAIDIEQAVEDIKNDNFIEFETIYEFHNLIRIYVGRNNN